MNRIEDCEAKAPDTTAIILAAGQGTRMRSSLPKVLHALAGKPLVHFPVTAAIDAGCQDVIVVVGHGRNEVESYLTSAFGNRVRTAVQKEQRGTGDAAAAGLSAAHPGTARVIIFNGDLPLVVAEDIAVVMRALMGHPDAKLALATCVFDQPFGYGRILRDPQGAIVAIREQRDLKGEELAVKEINPGIYGATAAFLREALPALKPNNAQGELYLTDIVAMAASSGKVVGVDSRAEVLVGVNDRDQLADAERSMLERIRKGWRKQGATVRDTARIENDVVLAPDCVIEGGVTLRGATRIGRGTVVDVGCVLSNVRVGEDVLVKPYSVLTDSTVGSKAQIGPFAHLRPESHIGEEAHVGNFVETKKTRMDRGSKANHLAYLGDAIVGEGANVGAGTICCNYDGFSKHTTVIGKGAFIGSDSQLVAPVTIGDGAYVGTGTTVTKDVPADALALSRVRQENKEGYASRLRGRMKAAKEAAAKQAK